MPPVNTIASRRHALLMAGSAAVLACGSAFDVDFRLAVGLLKDEVD